MRFFYDQSEKPRYVFMIQHQNRKQKITLSSEGE